MSFDDFQTSKIRTAKKPHRCEYCRSVIPAGVQYVAMAGKWQGYFFHGKGHLDCRELWNSLYNDWADCAEGMAWNICEVFLETGECIEAQHALNARRGLFPHAVNRVEFRLRNWLARTTLAELKGQNDE